MPNLRDLRTTLRVVEADDRGGAAFASAEDDLLLRAAREEFVRHGFQRSAVGDIARRAGVSRMTVNRRLGDKRAIIRAVLAREVLEFFGRAVGNSFAYASPAERAVETFVAGVVELRRNDLASAALEHDGEALLALAHDAGRAEFAQIRDVVAAGLADDEIGEGAALQVAEVALRLVLSLLVSPSDILSLGGERQARDFARHFLEPIVEAARLR